MIGGDAKSVAFAKRQSKTREFGPMLKRLTFVLAVLGSLTFRSSLSAQVQDHDDAAAIAAAVSHMLQSLRESDEVPPGSIQFDSRVLESREIANPAPGTRGTVTIYELAGSRREEVVAATLALLGAAAGNIEDARVCSADLQTCTLRDGVAVFAASDPVIENDAAEIVIQAIWLAPVVRRPVQDGIFRVLLRRNGTVWHVESVSTLRIS
jgi:hypothetical protein